MLVLSRKAGEAIAVEGGIQVKVIAVHGRTVKIGIEAPDSVSITRMELLLDTGSSSEVDPESKVTALSGSHQKWPHGSGRSGGGGGSLRTAMIPR